MEEGDTSVIAENRRFSPILFCLKTDSSSKHSLWAEEQRIEWVVIKKGVNNINLPVSQWCVLVPWACGPWVRGRGGNQRDRWKSWGEWKLLTFAGFITHGSFSWQLLDRTTVCLWSVQPSVDHQRMRGKDHMTSKTPSGSDYQMRSALGMHHNDLIHFCQVNPERPTLSSSSGFHWQVNANLKTWNSVFLECLDAELTHILIGF